MKLVSSDASFGRETDRVWSHCGNDEGASAGVTEAEKRFSIHEKRIVLNLEIHLGDVPIREECDGMFHVLAVENDGIFMEGKLRVKSDCFGGLLMRLEGFSEGDGAEDNRVITELGNGDDIMIAASWHRVEADDLLNNREDEVAAGLDDTAAEDNHVGIEEMTDIEAGVTEGFCSCAYDLRNNFIFLLQGTLEGVAFDDGEVVTSEFGDDTLTAVFDGFADLAFDGGTAGERFEAPTIATAAEGPAGLHDHMADLTCGIATSGDELTIHDDARTDTRADKDADRAGRGAGDAAPRFAESAEIDVVTDHNGHFKALAEERCDNHAGEGHVGSAHNSSLFGRHGARDSEANRGDVARGEFIFREEDGDDIGNGGDHMISLGIARSGHAFSGGDVAIRVGEGRQDFGAADIDAEVELVGVFAHGRPMVGDGRILAKWG